MSNSKPKKSNKLIYWLAGALLLLVVFAIIKNRGKDKGEKVSTEIVKKRTIRESVGASGRIFPEIEVKISSDVSGEVIELNVEEGDSVVKGQLLCRINPDTYVSQVERGNASVNNAKAQASNAKSSIESIKAQKEQTEAQLKNAKDILNRNSKLFKDGVISQQELDASQTSVNQLEANVRAIIANINASKESAKGAEFNVKSAEAGLKEMQTSLKRTSIYAPVGGIISKLNVKKGERVLGTIQMTGTEIMRIANMSTMEVQVEVSENDIPRVAIGNTVDIEVDAYADRIFKGNVTKIANSASNLTDASALNASLSSDKVTNFVVKIRVDPSSYADLLTSNKKHPFRPGMSATVDINTNVVDNVINVPIQAVTTRDEESDEKDKKPTDPAKEEKKELSKKIKEIVLVCVGDTVRAAEVKTGIQDDDYIQILSGINVGDEVVIGPYATISRKLKSGMRISRITEEEKKKEKK